MLVNTGEVIRDPKEGSIVFFQPWRGKNAKRKKPYPVIIVDGAFLRDGRVSNYFSWKRLTPTGRIKEGCGEDGYGNFTKAEGWKTEIKVTVLK